MMHDHLRNTAIHEAAHAAVSHLIGERFDFVEVTGPRNGIMQPYHSPCPTCGTSVPEARACQSCLEYFEKNDPATDERSRRIDRGYRVEAAVAAAGEIAESAFNDGAFLAEDDELAWDRDRVFTRASLRHLWLDNACSNYSGGNRDCAVCNESTKELRANVRSLLLESVTWSAIMALADKLSTGERMTGDEVTTFLSGQGIALGAAPIDTLWPALHK